MSLRIGGPAASIQLEDPVLGAPPVRRGRCASLAQEVFDTFHNGLVVLDRDGRILHANRAATLLLAGHLGGPLKTCCALLGCREQPRGCPTRLAAHSALPVPANLITLPSHAQRRKLWISAVPLGEGAPRVMLELRCADSRARRAEPVAAPAPVPLYVTTLGHTSVCTGQHSLDGEWLDQRAGQLLRYLIVNRARAVSADEIGENLWRGADYSVARNVRTCVHRLRAALEPARELHARSSYVLTCGSSYRLSPSSVRVDADEFESILVDATPDARAGEDAALARLEAGLALYGGEFLADSPFACWALSERARLHELACRALGVLVAAHHASGRAQSARTALERLCSMQPLDEALWRELIDAEIHEGRGTDAKRHYERLARQMNEAFGHGPRFSLGGLWRTRAAAGEPQPR